MTVKTFSVRALAREFGMSRETVSARLQQAGVLPTGESGGFPTYRLRDALKAVFEPSGTGAAADPDALPPFARHAYYKAERERLHLQAEAGDLVPAIEVDRKFAALLQIIGAAFERLPVELDEFVALPPAAIARTRQHLDGARRSIGDLISGDDHAKH